MRGKILNLQILNIFRIFSNSHKTGTYGYVVLEKSTVVENFVVNGIVTTRFYLFRKKLHFIFTKCTFCHYRVLLLKALLGPIQSSIVGTTLKSNKFDFIS